MIFLGIVTCNRPYFFKQCYESVKTIENLDFLAVVNDGQDDVNVNENVFYFKNKINLGVGKSKNILFKKAMELGADHIFIMEDDIIIKNKEVLNEYIKAKNITGIQHFCFAYHGPANKNGISGGKPSPRYIVDYGNIKIAINTHSVGAFCYYSKEVLKNVGLIDENFINAFEHVEHSYRIAKAEYTTPYWNWADLANSTDYLNEIECSENSSSISCRKDWKDNIIKAVDVFLKKHGFYPAWQNAVPDTSEKNVKTIMKKIFNKFSEKEC